MFQIDSPTNRVRESFHCACTWLGHDRSRRTVLAIRGKAIPSLPLPQWLPMAVALGIVAPVFTAPATAQAAPENRKLVVVLYPDESDGAPGIILVNRAIRSTFERVVLGHRDSQ